MITARARPPHVDACRDAVPRRTVFRRTVFRRTVPRQAAPRARSGLLAWCGLVIIAVVWGHALVSRGVPLHLGNVPPFIGHLRVLPLERWLLPVAVAAAFVGVAPLAVRRLPYPALLPLAWAGTAGWSVALAGSDGWRRLAAPFARPEEYRAALPALAAGPERFLHGFVAALPSYPTHVKGHPPGPVLVVWGLERLGLAGPGWAAGLAIAVGSSAVVAVALVVGLLVGEEAARAALPFLVLAPAAVWVATSMDALFLGTAAWAVALLALAARRAAVSRAAVSRAAIPRVAALRGHAGVIVPAAAAGTLLGSGAYLSYGLVPMVVVAFAAGLAAWGSRLPAGPVPWPPAPRAAGMSAAPPLAGPYAVRAAVPLAACAAGVVAVAAAFTVAGFSWLDGLRATHTAWAAGAGSDRPYGYFLVADLADLAVLTGPATAAALPLLRDRALWLPVGAALMAVLAADIAGFERGEVERIWLPFACWVVAATAALRPTGGGGARGGSSHGGSAHGWLALQAAVALAVQGLVFSPW